MALAPDEITSAYRDALGDAVVDTFTLHDQATVVVEPGSWVDAFRFAKESDVLDCDFLSFVSAIDWVELEGEDEKKAHDDAGEDGDTQTDGEQVFRMPLMPSYQVVGRVYSSVRHHGVTIKATCPKDSATIDTLIGLYGGANWHEREMMEMFGIDVVGHPDKSHLYLPTDFEGHPLRREYRLGAREVKPWPGDVDVEDMPDDAPVKDDAGNILEGFDEPEPEGDTAPEAPEASDDSGGDAS